MAFIEHLLNARTLALPSLGRRHPHFRGRDTKAQDGSQLGQARIGRSRNGMQSQAFRPGHTSWG